MGPPPRERCMFCFPSHPLTRPRLADGVVCRCTAAQAELVVHGRTALCITDAAALRLLVALTAGQAPTGDDAALSAAESQLLGAGVLCVDFLDRPGGAVAATLASTGYAQAPRPGAPPTDWCLQPQVVLRPEAGGWRLGSPLSRFEMRLVRAGLLDALQPDSGSDDQGLAALLAHALWAGGLSCAAGDTDGPAAGWSHEDLVFHAATRRHADHRARGRRAERPDWAPPPAPVVPSAALDEALRLRLQSLSFESVLAGRRSVRGALPPPSLDELCQLLCAVQAERGSRPGAPCRAYPSAGGLQSLDFHLAVAGPPGVDAALHRFDAAAGRLLLVVAPAGAAQRLLDEAGQAWGESNGTPCALLVISARLPELAARYEATAYRLALLEAGCATQLVTQVATALGLGSCVLGNGDSTLFALASGVPEWQAPALAEIAIAGHLPDVQR